MSTVETERKDFDSRALVRKTTVGLACFAPKTVELPATLLTSATEIVDLSTLGFIPIGMVTREGYTFSGEIEKEDVDALGYYSPVRSDVTRVPRTVSMTLLESGKKAIQELVRGTKITETQSATTGEVVFDEPDLPNFDEVRLIVVSADGPLSNHWIEGRGFFAAKISSLGEETWAHEGAHQRQVTFDIFNDDVEGVPVRHYFGGSGAILAKDILGYAQGV
ncbi:hypothetical protein HD598_002167 [Neomicrococcus aestuarii]|uniref:Major tail protein n=1 Tax=Neomicrococcus aestuarii TaxID=556325 RepID=A0A7W8TV47_9MICC|nr:hypothetical protein [Neomicrococcus aestuarii]MBB5513480.1 hypothetical protein [Neomicrococcus aestuarii]